MAFKLEKYDGSSNATLEDLGTVKAAAGKGGTIALVRKNWSDATKRVAVIIKDKSGKSAVIACSKQVSDALRSGKMKLNQLIGLNIIEDKEGRNFISMGAAGAIQEFAVDGMKEEKVEAEKATFLPEELVF